jgi:hypothetical protein
MLKCFRTRFSRNALAEHWSSNPALSRFSIAVFLQYD